jgi:hypothetical protein
VKGKNPKKTGICASFGGEIIVDYAEVKKSSKGSWLQEFGLAIEPPLQNLGLSNRSYWEACCFAIQSQLQNGEQQ